MRRGAAACALLVAALAPGRSADATVSVGDPQLGFRFSLPDGFAHFREGLGGPDIVQSYLLPPTGDQAMGTVVLVERMHGTLGRSRLESSRKTRDGRTLQVFEEKWKSFTIQGARVPEVVEGVDCVTLNAQVPLSPEAIQVKVFGEARREDELRRVLRSVLSTLEGRTNWLTEEEAGKRLGEGIVRLGVTLGLLGLGVYWLVKRIRSKRAAPPSKVR